MDLSELTREERVALVGLLELIVGADARVSDDEADEMGAIVEAVGEDAYREAAEEVDRRFDDESQLRVFLPTIQRQNARELIYETALEAALPDAVGARESQLLDWLATVWGITTRIEE